MIRARDVFTKSLGFNWHNHLGKSPQKTCGKGRDFKKNEKKEKEWDNFFGLQRVNQVSSLLFGNSERLPIGVTLAIATISLSSKDADLIDPTVLKG